MQNLSIQSQVDVIKKATEIASKSKESALKFLTDARIIEPKNNTKSSQLAKERR
jgi:hypothetical protein